MNIKCKKSDLLNSINISLKAIPGKTTMQILSFIAIVAENNKINLVSNNLELGIETSLEAEVIEPGKICVDAKMFSEIIRKLPSDEITMIVDDRNSDTEEIASMQIKSGRAKFEISAMSTDEFVFLPNIQSDDNIQISQYDLRAIINQTEFSISDNENQKVMTGELFEVTENQLRVISLDGNRISIRRLTLDNQYPSKKVIIPGKTLREISKILSDKVDDNVDIYFSENHIIFKFESTTVLSRLIDGNYYDVDRMLSDDYKVKIKANKAELTETIDRSMLLRRESDKKPIVFNIKDGKIEFNMKTSIGSMDEEMEVEKEGEDLRIGFNPKFMLDALKNIEDEDVDIYFKSAKSPCFIKNDEKTYIYLILPINF